LYNARVADVPDTIVLERDRDLAGRRHEIWVRRGLLGVLCAVPLLALLNLFGQRPQTWSAASSEAKLSVYAPARVRGGLIYEARFHVTALHTVHHATLVLDPGWLEGMTMNTLEPSPVSETSVDGSISLDLGHIPAGTSYIQFIQFQVDPTNVGHRSANAYLYDGNRKLVEIRRAITVFP
jgi:hypothetical protein